MKCLWLSLTNMMDVEFNDCGKKSVPVKNNIEALAGFSAFDKCVDFAGRIVYDDHNVEVFNFGKHKGKPVEKGA